VNPTSEWHFLGQARTAENKGRKVEKPIYNYWLTRLTDIRKRFEDNNFEVHMAKDMDAAKTIILENIIPETGARSVSWGGSMTFTRSGIYDALKAHPTLEIIDTYDKTIPREEMLERRRQALLVDLFITGTNAVTESGFLVNLDMIGNRVAALTFGPRHVIVMAGRNKIVKTTGDAMRRVKEYAAPVNVLRLEKKTPCAKTSACMDCNSPDRICNTWTITEKSYPKGRIKVVLINQDLGI
jgi:L-lactate utilization protein LutB